MRAGLCLYWGSQRILSGKHIKLVLEPTADPDQTAIDAIAFFQPASVLNQDYDQIRIHYELSLNHFRGIDSVQLLIRDIIS